MINYDLIDGECVSNGKEEDGKLNLTSNGTEMNNGNKPNNVLNQNGTINTDVS
jgi:hypothetical protein